MDNMYTFAAIRGIQASRAFYVAMIPLKTLERLFSYDEEVTCAPDCYHSEVESGSFMMVG
ncbi:hypothetical protein HZF05_07355 [Sphingomonas sp. CGMCC 1.13654]|uniref:Uncharacterized protein n=1 Tax=Sphingomonas chungangi TaxID=2683589 RepID=A0A838L6Z3_9SPHN|nr:hypothetical protein [Sphingomonas chungangi]MBA2933916.1 hypothetical protein [Sphingomonas chungangi]MVW55245.1 hypothetical protein [Sphingomonas chungangi]